MPIPSSGVSTPPTEGGTPPSGFGDGWQDVFRGGRIFEPLMQRAPPDAAKRTAPVADRPFDFSFPQSLQLPSQDASDVAAAREASLPPLQSVMELTTAWKPPVRTGEETEAQLLEQRQASGAYYCYLFVGCAFVLNAHIHRMTTTVHRHGVAGGKWDAGRRHDLLPEER